MLRSEIDFPLVSQIGDRRCPECRSSMRLAWIEPDEKPGYDKRTFECLHCQPLGYRDGETQVIGQRGAEKSERTSSAFFAKHNFGG